MLVLTRKQQEKIRIGDQITITVLRTKGKAVRLGIEAPDHIAVIRGELTFEVCSDESPANSVNVDVPVEAETPVDVEVVRTTAPTARKCSNWSPAARDGVSSNRLPGNAKPQVSFERVSREKVAETLQGLKSNGGPLSAMLKRRPLSA